MLIVALIGIYYPKADEITLPVIVMEKMHSSLRGLVEEHADIPVNVTLSILNDVCCGLQYLHSRKPPIVHQNLTPNNILLCYHFKAKISDIGIVNTTDTQALPQATKMSAFLPFESLTNKSASDPSLDVFSFGGIILYISTNQWPQPAQILFNHDTDKGSVALTELQRHRDTLNRLTGSYMQLKPLVMACLNDSPQDRPSAAQALMEIKKVKIAHTQKLCSMIWGVEDSTLQSQKEQEQPQKAQLQQEQQQDVEESHLRLEIQKQQILKQQKQWEEKRQQKIQQKQKQSPQVSQLYIHICSVLVH